MFIFKKPIKS